MAINRVPLRDLRPPTSGGGTAQYLADFIEDMRKGEVSFAYQYRWPAMIVTGLTGTLSDQGTRTGTLVTDDQSADVRLASLLVGRVFLLRKNGNHLPGQIRVGRIAENDVPIPEFSISKHHCLLRPAPNRTTIEDMGSTNGSLVNGTKLIPHQQYAVEDGSEIVLGRFVFLFFTARGFVDYVKRELENSSA
jgi:FHA domain